MGVPRSHIAYTDYSGGDANVIQGCTPVSAGCQHCYARAIYERFGRDFDTVRSDESGEKIGRLLNWKPGVTGLRRFPNTRPMVFLCDTGDFLHEAVPFHVLCWIMDLVYRRDDIDWQLLTKRPQRFPEMIRALEMLGHSLPLPPWVWLGVTAENQAMADERIPLLLQVPAAVKWVSAEPLLGPLDLHRWLGPRAEGEPFTDSIGGQHHHMARGIEWLVVGAESGPKRRPFDVAWAEDLYRQTQEAWRDGVDRGPCAFFGKQASGLRPGVPLLVYGAPVHEWPEVTP